MLEDLRTFVRSQWLFLAVWAACSVFVSWVILSPTFLPLLDWPQHVFVNGTLSELANQELRLRDYYQSDWHVTTYIGAYLPALALGWVFPIELAMRLVLVGALVANPLALTILLRGFGRSAWPSLLSLPAAFGYAFYMGFFPFTVALPGLIAGIGMVRLISLDATRSRVAAFALLAAWVFLCHSLVFMVLCAAGGVLGVAYNITRPKRILVTAAAYLPGLALFATWFYTHFVIDPASRLGAGQAAYHGTNSAEGKLFGAVFIPFRDNLRALASNFMEGIAGDDDLAAMKYWFACASVLFALGSAAAIYRSVQRRRETEAAGDDDASDGIQRQRTRRFALIGHELAALVTVATMASFYFLLPFDVAGVYAVNPRFASVSAVALLLLVPRLFDTEWLNLLVMVPVIAFLGWHGLNVQEAFEGASEEAEGLFEVVEDVELGSTTYGLIYNPMSEHVSRPVFLHAAAYIPPERGGGIGFTFLNNSSMPLRLANPAALPYPGQRGEWEPHRIRYDIYGAFYDYYLVRGRSSVGYQMRGADLELVSQAGGWLLFRTERSTEARAVYSLLEHADEARVFVERYGDPVPCFAWDGHKIPCPGEEWNYVGPVMLPLGSIQAPCIWAHPFDDATLQILYDELPANGTEIRGFYGLSNGLYDSRGRIDEPVTLGLEVNGERIETYSTPPRRGYETFEYVRPAEEGPIETLRFHIDATDAGARHFCFSGTIFAPSAE